MHRKFIWHSASRESIFSGDFNNYRKAKDDYFRPAFTAKRAIFVKSPDLFIFQVVAR
jgi:hypothetical protein